MLRAMIAVGGLALLASGTARADGDVMQLGRYQPAKQGFTGTAASAADTANVDSDTVLTHGWRRSWYRRGFSSVYFGGFSGYRGFYGWPAYSYGYRGFSAWPGYAYGYRSFYGAPWYYGSGLALGYYRPGFAVSVYSAPRYYYSFSSLYYPRYCSYGFGYPSYGIGGFLRIAGDSAATVALDLPRRPATPLATDPDAPLRYDGGPDRPVPLPAPDLNPPRRTEPSPETDSVPVSVKKPQHRYLAYGEKR